MASQNCCKQWRAYSCREAFVRCLAGPCGSGWKKQPFEEVFRLDIPRTPGGHSGAECTRFSNEKISREERRASKGQFSSERLLEGFPPPVVHLRSSSLPGKVLSTTSGRFRKAKDGFTTCSIVEKMSTKYLGHEAVRVDQIMGEANQVYSELGRMVKLAQA